MAHFFHLDLQEKTVTWYIYIYSYQQCAALRKTQQTEQLCVYVLQIITQFISENKNVTNI